MPERLSRSLDSSFGQHNPIDAIGRAPLSTKFQSCIAAHDVLLWHSQCQAGPFRRTLQDDDSKGNT